MRFAGEAHPEGNPIVQGKPSGVCQFSGSARSEKQSIGVGLFLCALGRDGNRSVRSTSRPRAWALVSMKRASISLQKGPSST
ncbi:hypothetical protein RZS08_11715, partial [Arthrospira platensis SPKY1]|nr:hypothetical protein [Arthrospira platensis SPKY1]